MKTEKPKPAAIPTNEVSFMITETEHQVKIQDYLKRNAYKFRRTHRKGKEQAYYVQTTCAQEAFYIGCNLVAIVNNIFD
ncbi:hypothetical protein AHMF7605_11905 [Adhaeribacter arboris]|uniref:Uncharacterized protein n=1 Tax=Adhaeribacter arboris TaxID=2072846 RepID=A0A2T2YF84_9BACT|nr:hypothetical protein [Adhaeribacter arboris]PSR54175.1 hypothetical protein AHMF7605_11905 [Adhaeribacter arboris]